MTDALEIIYDETVTPLSPEVAQRRKEYAEIIAAQYGNPPEDRDPFVQWNWRYDQLPLVMTALHKHADGDVIVETDTDQSNLIKVTDDELGSFYYLYYHLGTIESFPPGPLSEPAEKNMITLGTTFSIVDSLEELHQTGQRVDVTNMSEEEMMKFFNPKDGVNNVE